MSDQTAESYDSIYVTRYMGAKYKLLGLVIPALRQQVQPGGVVVDLMAGTHAIGYAMKRTNKVYANDIQAYSKVFGDALLTNTKWSDVGERAEHDFRLCKAKRSNAGWFSQIYGDTYFAVSQCREIEAIRARIDEIDDQQLRAVYLLVLCSAMALCQSSPGHFAQYMPPSHSRVQSLRSMSVLDAFLARCRDLRIDVTDRGNQVARENSFSLIESQELAHFAGAGSVVYLDPPYTTAQYSRYYHLLETVVLNDEPNVGFKGLYRNDRYQSPFCSSAQVTQSFSKIIGVCREREWPIVISYSSHGLIKLDDLVMLLKESYPKVSVVGSSYNHSMQGRGVVQNRTEFVLTGTWAGLSSEN